MSDQQIELLEKILQAATKDPTAPIKATIDSLLDPLPQPEENITAPAGVLAPKNSVPTMYERIERIEAMLAEQAANPQHKVVVPDGYPLPAEDENDAALQYVEALRALEAAHRVNISIAENWKDIVIRPSSPFQLAMVTTSALAGIADQVRGQLAIDVLKVSIDRSFAELAVRLAGPGTDIEVANGEFIQWAMDKMVTAAAAGDAQAQLLMSNLQTVGLL